MSALPASSEPVNPTAFTLGWSTSAAPISEPRAEEKRKDAWRQAALAHAARDDLADHLAGAGMGVVRLHNHGIAGSKGGGGISAGDRKCKGKIAGAEDGDGPEGLIMERMSERASGLRSGCAGSMRAIDPGAFFHHLRKKTN